MTDTKEVYISVDVETSGPIPGEYSLLSIGACLAYSPNQVFECYLKPVSDRADPKALEVTGLSMERLHREGLEPKVAMESFLSWVSDICGEEGKPVFVGFNAPFDWSFINYYFHRYLGQNPFGFSALDIKALYMGATGCTWEKTRSSEMSRALNATLRGDHQAAHDAQFQAELFRLVRRFPRM